MGLNESKYQWVIDAQRAEQRDARQKALENAQRRELALERRECHCPVDVTLDIVQSICICGDWRHWAPTFGCPAATSLQKRGLFAVLTSSWMAPTEAA